MSSIKKRKVANDFISNIIKIDDSEDHCDNDIRNSLNYIDRYIKYNKITIEGDDDKIIISFIKILLEKIILKFFDLENCSEYKEILLEYTKYLINIFKENIRIINDKLRDDQSHKDKIIEEELSIILDKENEDLIRKINEVTSNKVIDKTKKTDNIINIDDNIFITNNNFLEKYSDSTILFKEKLLTTGGNIYINTVHEITCENIDTIDDLGILYFIYKNFISFSYYIIKKTAISYRYAIYITIDILNSFKQRPLKSTLVDFSLDISHNDYNLKFINKIQSTLKTYHGTNHGTNHERNYTLLISDLEDFNGYLERHFDYINGLTFRQQCVINDYTYKYNKVYTNFIIYKKDKPNIDTDISTDFYTTHINHAGFGGGFFHQIKDVLGTDKITYKENDLKKKTNDEMVYNTKNIFGYDIDLITNSQWNLIFQKYTEELNNIISNLPDIMYKDDFYIYRGSTIDYVTESMSSGDIYESERFNSFSLNFDLAKEFCQMTPDSVIYRLKIPKYTPVKILFIASISHFNYELEILTLNNQKFKYIDKNKIPIYTFNEKLNIVCPDNKGDKVNLLNIINLELS